MSELSANQMIQKTVVIVTRLHFGQFRKNAINGIQLPYSTHPLEVMKTVWRWGAGCTENMIAAGCHDVFEECFTSDGKRYDRVLLKKEFDVEFPLLQSLETASDYEIMAYGDCLKDAFSIVEELTFLGDKSEKETYMASFC